MTDQHGLDREGMRRVLVSIGRPLPTRSSVVGQVVGLCGPVSGRTLMLVVLLGLVALLGLTGLAAGGDGGIIGNGEKRSGGASDTLANPLIEIEKVSHPVSHSLYNFFQNLSKPVDPAPQPRDPAAATSPIRLCACLVVIGLIFLILRERDRTDLEYRRRRR